MEDYVKLLISSKYGNQDMVIRDFGGGFYGRVFLAEWDQFPYQVIVKFFLKDGLCTREKLQLEELRKHALLKVPGIYDMHQSNEQIPYDALLMEFVEGKNAGAIECDQANKEVIANQIVDNLIAIHSYVHEEGFGELNDTIFHRDWQSYYKPIVKNIVEDAEVLYEKKSISKKCIETVRIAYQNFDEIFSLPIIEASLIHGDYNNWNIMLDTEEKNAIAVIDPYNCSFADPEYDLYQLNNANGKEYGLLDLYESKCTLSPNWRVKIAFYELFSELMHYSNSGVMPNMEALDQEAEQLRKQM